MKRISVITAALLAALSVSAQKLPMREYVDNLMSKMTLDEKIGQIGRASCRERVCHRV